MEIISPSQTTRQRAYELFMQAEMPMVTVTKTFDLTNLVRHSHKTGMKFSMLFLYCIGRAALEIPELRYLPCAEGFKKFDGICLNTLVEDSAGWISFCDIPLSKDLKTFASDYDCLTKQVHDTATTYKIPECAPICTSAITNCDFDSIVNVYHSFFDNTIFMAWGKYRKCFKLFGGYRFKRYTLPVSIQFHHAIMDGHHVGHWFNLIQNTINSIHKQ